MISEFLIWISKRMKDATEWVAIALFGFGDFIIGVMSLYAATPKGDGRQTFYLIAAVAISAMTSGLQIIVWKKMKKLREIRLLSAQLRKKKIEPTAGILSAMEGRWWVSPLGWFIMILDSVIDMGVVPSITETNITIANMFTKWSDIFIFTANHLSIYTRILMITVFMLSLFGEPLLDYFSSKQEDGVIETLER